LEKQLPGIFQQLPKKDATSRCSHHYRLWTSMGVVGLKKYFFGSRFNKIMVNIGQDAFPLSKNKKIKS
jgi:hypothetical protein